MSHIDWGGEQTTIYKGVETFPSRPILKPWGEVRKGKPKENNIC